MHSVDLKNENPCSGCGSCAAICPRSAITLALDTAGFYQAVVDRKKCVDCGLCLQVCRRFTPVEETVDLRRSPLYALQSARKSTVLHCSSGGIAHELAALTIARGGIVCGAVYDLATNSVRHEIVMDERGICRLDGSKYLQSRTDEAFRQILEEAQRTPCAVFGTPCQISSLAIAAERKGVRGKLLLAEIFCHGVPSYWIWEESLRIIKKKLNAEVFEDVQFRYKKDDWHSYCLKITTGGRTYYGKRETELFWQVFFENVLLGDACQVCTARKEMSMADLRLGDYWGRYFRHRSDGVSAVFALTRQGREAVEALLDEGRVVKLDATTAEEMLLAQNMAGYHNDALHNAAMEVLRNEGVQKAVAFYRGRQSVRAKLKRTLLRVSAILPDPIRAKLRKANSSRSLLK